MHKETKTNEMFLGDYTMQCKKLMQNKSSQKIWAGKNGEKPP